MSKNVLLNSAGQLFSLLGLVALGNPRPAPRYLAPTHQPLLAGTLAQSSLIFPQLLSICTSLSGTCRTVQRQLIISAAAAPSELSHGCLTRLPSGSINGSSNGTATPSISAWLSRSRPSCVDCQTFAIGSIKPRSICSRIDTCAPPSNASITSVRAMV